MALRLNHNPYPGVNAHFNSHLQTKAGLWESFHSTHIAVIRAKLDQILPPGYYALSEKSLQISTISIGDKITSRAKMDIGIFADEPEPMGGTSTQMAVATPTRTSPLPRTITEDDLIDSVTIYALEDDMPGPLVARIELLSPANKPPQSYHRTYLTKRTQTLAAGVVLLEIDLLHEMAPVLPHLPAYRNPHDEDAYPYMVLVSNPQPDMQRGQFAYYGVSLMQTLPTIAMPLTGDDVLPLPLQDIYEQTFNSLRLTRIVVDYAQTPDHFERYRTDDQQTIRDLMARLAAQYPATS